MVFDGIQLYLILFIPIRSIFHCMSTSISCTLSITSSQPRLDAQCDRHSFCLIERNWQGCLVSLMHSVGKMPPLIQCAAQPHQMKSMNTVGTWYRRRRATGMHIRKTQPPLKTSYVLLKPLFSS